MRSANKHPAAQQQRRKQAQRAGRNPPGSETGQRENGANGQQTVRGQAEEEPGAANETLDHQPGRCEKKQIDEIHWLGREGKKENSPCIEMQGLFGGKGLQPVSGPAWD